jgi:N-acyl homoserine lactone hydrolase
MFTVDVLVQGYPGRTLYHGGLGWSTIALVRGGPYRLLVDVGSFNVRPYLLQRLGEHGVAPGEITHVLLTHAHWDHAVNWTLFPDAEVVIGERELAWAVDEPPDGWHVPELYLRELAHSARLRVVRDGETVVPGVVAYDVPGHTPGHLCYVAEGPAHDWIFTGDAAKNRAELVSHDVDMTLDRAASQRSLAKMWRLWTRRPENVLIPGHDVPMRLDGTRPVYADVRRAAVFAWLGTQLNERTTFSLTGE